MTSERTRTDWKGLYEASVIAHDQTKKALEEALNSALSFGKENDDLRDELADAKKQVEKARIQGMHDATGLLLRDGQ